MNTKLNEITLPLDLCYCTGRTICYTLCILVVFQEVPEAVSLERSWILCRWQWLGFVSLSTAARQIVLLQKPISLNRGSVGDVAFSRTANVSEIGENIVDWVTGHFMCNCRTCLDARCVSILTIGITLDPETLFLVDTSSVAWWKGERTVRD